MTWTKLSDDYSDDTWTLSDAAFRLHTEALVWSNRKLLDCVIPKDDLRRFAKNPQPVQELVDGGFWQDAGQSYVITHHAQYQRDRQSVISQQAANRANGGKGGRPKGKPREQKTQSVNDSQSNSMRRGFSDPSSGVEGKTLENTGRKTQSVSESQSYLKTKRDGPGIEGDNPLEKSDWTQAMDNGWIAYETAPVGPSPSKALPLAYAVSEPPPTDPDLAGCSVPGCSGKVTEVLRRHYGQVCFRHASAVAV